MVLPKDAIPIETSELVAQGSIEEAIPGLWIDLDLDTISAPNRVSRTGALKSLAIRRWAPAWYSPAVR